MSDAIAISTIDSLYGVSDGTTVTIEGVFGERNSPPISFLHVDGKQVVWIELTSGNSGAAFVTTVPSCPATIILTGKVVEYVGPQKASSGGRHYNVYRETALDVDRWSCR